MTSEPLPYGRGKNGLGKIFAPGGEITLPARPNFGLVRFGGVCFMLLTGAGLSREFKSKNTRPIRCSDSRRIRRLAQAARLFLSLDLNVKLEQLPIAKR
jgi:hypothetical protein